MGVHNHATKVVSKLPPAKAFTFLVEDFNHLVPVAAPHVVQTVDLHEGDNGPGSIKHIKFVEGRKFKDLKYRVEIVDYEKFVYKFTIIGGDVIREGIEKIETEIKIEESSEGGSILQGNSTYYLKGDAKLNIEEIKVGKENSAGIFKHFESYVSAQA